MNLTKKDIKVITAALESFISIKDDGIFFDVAYDSEGLRGTDYKKTLSKLKEANNGRQAAC